MTSNRFDRFVDGALDIVGGAWNEARYNFVAGIDARARDEERDNNITRAAVAMLDGGLSLEQTTAMLQKHWDMRRSEVLPLVAWAQRQIPPKCVRPEKNQKKI